MKKKILIIVIIFCFIGASIVPNILALEIEEKKIDTSNAIGLFRPVIIDVGDIYIAYNESTDETKVFVECNNVEPVNLGLGKKVIFCADYNIDLRGVDWGEGLLTFTNDDGSLWGGLSISWQGGYTSTGQIEYDQFITPTSDEWEVEIDIKLCGGYEKGDETHEECCFTNATLSHTSDITAFKISNADGTECPCKIKNSAESTGTPSFDKPSNSLLFQFLQNQPILFQLLQRFFQL